MRRFTPSHPSLPIRPTMSTALPRLTAHPTAPLDLHAAPTTRTLLGRRQFAQAALLSAVPALWAPTSAWAKDTALPVPASLPAAAQAAAAQGEPLVILVTLPGCPYCELVRRSYLLPGRAQGGLHAWQLDITNRTAPLLGFDGRPTNARAQLLAWNTRFTPTVLFIGPQGQTLAEPLEGVAVPDFYGAYLDDRLAVARQGLKALKR